MERLSRDGVALASTETGSGAPPLVLVHCWCGDHTHLTPQFEYFGRTHRVVAVDLRGHGASDKPLLPVPDQQVLFPSGQSEVPWKRVTSAGVVLNLASA